jgi:hypothetical protein
VEVEPGLVKIEKLIEDWMIGNGLGISARCLDPRRDLWEEGKNKNGISPVATRGKVHHGLPECFLFLCKKLWSFRFGLQWASLHLDKQAFLFYSDF